MSKSSWRCFCCGCEMAAAVGGPSPCHLPLVPRFANAGTFVYSLQEGTSSSKGRWHLDAATDICRSCSGVGHPPLQRRAPLRKKRKNFLVANTGDLKALRSVSKLHDNQILFPCMGGSHRRLAVYAAVELGRYDSMDALNLSWKQWDIRSKSWAPTSAQEYLATGDPF